MFINYASDCAVYQINGKFYNIYAWFGVSEDGNLGWYIYEFVKDQYKLDDPSVQDFYKQFSFDDWM